jgi:hypothetical protein
LVFFPAAHFLPGKDLSVIAEIARLFEFVAGLYCDRQAGLQAEVGTSFYQSTFAIVLDNSAT